MDEAVACRINIGPRERRARRNFGLIGLALGVLVSAVLLATHAGWLARLSVFLPFWVGGIGLFQAYEKT